MSRPVPLHVLQMFIDHPDMLRLPLEPLHGWRGSRDEGGHSHCCFCAWTIYHGDSVVGCYLEYVSTVFCERCYRDNPDIFREWMSPMSTARG